MIQASIRERMHGRAFWLVRHEEDLAIGSVRTGPDGGGVELNEDGCPRASEDSKGRCSPA